MHAHVQKTLDAHTREIMDMSRRINTFNADVQHLLRKQSKIDQLFANQIKSNYEISSIKDQVKNIDLIIQKIDSAVDKIEATLIRKDAESHLRGVFFKTLPYILILILLLAYLIDDNALRSIFTKAFWLP